MQVKRQNMKTAYAGIDYGLGRTNISDTGIRFGVIPMNEVSQAWSDSSEAQYGEPTCPECSGKVVDRHVRVESCATGVAVILDDEARETYKENSEHGFMEYACDACKLLLAGEDVFPEDPREFTYEAEGYALRQGHDDCDIWVMRSSYFTYAQFCSPCAPGACYLLNPLDEPSEANKAYCLGHDWFDDKKAPYPVYVVATGKLLPSD